MMRVDPREFGVARNSLIEGLQAEGIPCSGGYVMSLPQQPMFRNKAFGPYLPAKSEELNYQKTRCPNSDLLCEQTIWLEQSIFLGGRKDMDDIANAFEKTYQHRHELSSGLDA